MMTRLPPMTSALSEASLSSLVEVSSSSSRGRNNISIGEAAAYMVAQILGGITAAFTYALMEHGRTFPLGPGKGHNWIGVSVAEIVYTFVLCFVVLNVATVKSPLSQYFGLAIASCVTAGGYAIGAIS